MRLNLYTLLAVPLLAATVRVPVHQPVESDSKIVVRPSQFISHISPWMYGSCIEDVNHEIYGGLYAQRIFGESFEEPPGSPLAGWTGFGGEWCVQNNLLQVKADEGAKLVRNEPVVGDGTVEVFVRFADDQGDNAGLILRVADPHTGPDRWTGYEVSLSIRNQSLVLGRHRNNWEPIRTVFTPVVANHGYRLRVEMTGSTLRCFVNGGSKPLLEYNDTEHPLAKGLVGIRTWNSNASFYNLTITANGETVADPLNGIGMKSEVGSVSGMWDPVVTGGAQARFTWDGDQPYNTLHSQRLEHTGGAGTVGIANRGLNRWGISVRQGQRMQGSLYLQSTSATPVGVALQSADGKRTYVQQTVSSAGRNWVQREFKLTPNATDPNARFAIWLTSPGRVNVDQVYLSDTGKALFHGLPFRADIGNKLVEQGLTFMRYGGTMVNAPEYRWKKMIGPRDRRPQYKGHWYPYSTNGFGIEEFLQFCEAARIEPAFAINIEETPEDAADLVEYLNGSVNTAWGAKRAANGHPKPYNVRYIEIGNEEAIDGSQAWYQRYLERFELLYAAMHKRDPSIQFVNAAWWKSNEPWCKRIAQALNGKAALWDLHVGGDGLRDAEDADRTLAEMKRLFGEWIPGSNMRVAIFEENGDRHDFQRALGHARMLNVTQRYGDFVRMDCPANCLQPLGQNDNGWNQGQVFFTPDRAWGMPPYYVQQMAARNHLPLGVATDVESPERDLDVTATHSEDGKTLVLKVVNSGSQPHRADIRLEQFTPKTQVVVWTISGELTAVNTPDDPERIRWTKIRADIAGAMFNYAFAPHSYTILRLRKK